MQRQTRDPQDSIHRGQTLIELIAVLVIISAALAIALPTIAYQRSSNMIEGSKNNLLILGVSHALYAADHNGNQWTTTPHDVAEYGNDINGAFSNWFDAHPDSDLAIFSGQLAIYLGWAIDPNAGNVNLWLYAFNAYGMPINFEAPIEGFGYHRMHYVRSFNSYVDGRVYSSTFFAPADEQAIAAVGDCFDTPYEFCVSDSGYTYWPSYSLSPAALFSPDIWTLPEGEFPGSMSAIFQYDQAFQVPTFAQAKYPDLKTHIMEQHWLQNNLAGLCNPNPPPSPGDYDGCIPYFFNASINSAPATLFYDGHVRLLPNTEVAVADAQIGLWRRDTPWGSNGYLHEYAYMTEAPDLSHHILTDGGILGRDTLGLIDAAAHADVLRRHVGRRASRLPKPNAVAAAPGAAIDDPALHVQSIPLP